FSLLETRKQKMLQEIFHFFLKSPAFCPKPVLLVSLSRNIFTCQNDLLFSRFDLSECCLHGRPTIGYNWRLCDGAAIAFLQLSFVLMLNRITKIEPMTFSCTIAKPLVVRSAYSLHR